jgi:hypothetical protein
MIPQPSLLNGTAGCRSSSPDESGRLRSSTGITTSLANHRCQLFRCGGKQKGRRRVSDRWMGTCERESVPPRCFSVPGIIQLCRRIARTISGRVILRPTLSQTTSLKVPGERRACADRHPVHKVPKGGRDGRHKQRSCLNAEARALPGPLSHPHWLILYAASLPNSARSSKFLMNWETWTHRFTRLIPFMYSPASCCSRCVVITSFP